MHRDWEKTEPWPAGPGSGEGCGALLSPSSPCQPAQAQPTLQLASFHPSSSACWSGMVPGGHPWDRKARKPLTAPRSLFCPRPVAQFAVEFNQVPLTP